MKMIDDVAYVEAVKFEQQADNVGVLLHALGVDTVDDGLRSIRLMKGIVDVVYKLHDKEFVLGGLK